MFAEKRPRIHICVGLAHSVAVRGEGHLPALPGCLAARNGWGCLRSGQGVAPNSIGFIFKLGQITARLAAYFVTRITRLLRISLSEDGLLRSLFPITRNGKVEPVPRVSVERLFDLIAGDGDLCHFGS